MTYAVYSLVPALFLGIHAIKMTCTKSADRKLHLAKSKLSKVCAGLYLLIGAAMLVMRITFHFQPKHTHQFSHEHAWSFESSRSFLIRFWGVMQYGASIVLTICYIRSAHKIRKAAH